MDDRVQPGPLPPPGPPGGADHTAPASTSNANHTEQRYRSFDELTAEKITSARHACYAAAAEAVSILQNGRRLVGEQMFAAAHAQTVRAWWDRVEVEITTKKLTGDHAVRRVRSWARHYLTGEPPAPQPGTLFDHALAHASRRAARDFLTASGHLLTHHLATEPGDEADPPGPGMPGDHHPGPGHPAASPATRAALSPTTTHTP
ncbi:hypothetical protein ACFWY5_57085 [Nonomuraea sp. NPDC059007]|uniref:hypothetical protein n=1 Tax=Nonomuraea sp. NPDC059007 TaxID=3346692 RepID=UPI0036C13DA4